MRKFEFVERIKESCINDNGIIRLPERSTANSAGYDFYSPEAVILEPGKIKYVKTGVKAYMESGEMLVLCNRSSNPKKKRLVLVNGIGIVDADHDLKMKRMLFRAGHDKIISTFFDLEISDDVLAI